MIYGWSTISTDSRVECEASTSGALRPVPKDALLIDGNRVVEKRLLGLLPLDLVRPNLAQAGGLRRWGPFELNRCLLRRVHFNDALTFARYSSAFCKICA